MRGVTVYVRRPVEGAPDELGNPSESWGVPEAVTDVLVLAGASADVLESDRPHGVTVAYTLTFPKTYSASLRGCEVQVPGDAGWYAVDGDPKPQIDGQLMRPLRRWNRTVEAVRLDG